MEGDVRVLLVALFYNLLIFSSCFLAFLYLRRLRGDRRQRGVRTLQKVRSAHDTCCHHHHSQPPVKSRLVRECYSAPASPRSYSFHQCKTNDFETSDDIVSIRNNGQSCRHLGQRRDQIPRATTSKYRYENALVPSLGQITSGTTTSQDNEHDFFLVPYAHGSSDEEPSKSKASSQVSSSPNRTQNPACLHSQTRNSVNGAYNNADLSSSTVSFSQYQDPSVSRTALNSNFYTNGINQTRGITSSIERRHFPLHEYRSMSDNQFNRHSFYRNRSYQAIKVVPTLRSSFSSSALHERCQQPFHHPSRPEHHYHRHHYNDEPITILGWARVLIQVEDKRFESTDVQFYLLFLRMCQTITFILSLLALLVVLPTNLSCPSKSSTDSWLDRASAQNILPEGGRIWVLMACTWINSIIIYYYVYQFWNGVCDPVLLRNTDSFNPETYTIMVEGIPPPETDPSVLLDHFNRLFPDRVVCANLILDFSELLIAKRALEKTILCLFRAATLRAQRMGSSNRSFNHPLLSERHVNESGASLRDVTISNDTSSCSPQASEGPASAGVVSHTDHVCRGKGIALALSDLRLCQAADVGYWRSLVEMRSMKVNDVLAKPPSKNAGVGFVSFRDTNCVMQCLEDPRVVGIHYDWHLSPAPPPQDVLWLNIHISKNQRRIRAVAFNSLLIVVSIILTSSAMLTNALLPLAENVEKAFNEADFLNSAIVAVRLSVTGWGAPLILFIINSLCLPIMVQWVADSVGYWRLSETESAVLHGNVIFLILTTVIFPTIGNGSIGALIVQMYETQIQEWNTSLGKLIVGQSGSFTLRYLLNGCFLHSASQLLQLGQLSWFGVLSTLGKDTQQWNFDFGYSYAFCLSIFFMVLSFGVVIPLVFPFGCLFFTMKYLVDKYNFLFGLWKVEQESAGAVALIACRYLLAAVGFFQFVMSGYFIAFGLHLASHELKAIPEKSLEPVELSRISPGRGLVLGGTLLFVVSLVSAILLIGHSTDVCHGTRTRISRAPEPVSSFLTPAQENQLCRSYMHPYEHEIEERLKARNNSAVNDDS